MRKEGGGGGGGCCFGYGIDRMMVNVIDGKGEEKNNQWSEDRGINFRTRVICKHWMPLMFWGESDSLAPIPIQSSQHQH